MPKFDRESSANYRNQVVLRDVAYDRFAAAEIDPDRPLAMR